MRPVEDIKRKGNSREERGGFCLKSDENKVEKEETRRRAKNKKTGKILF
jgi:hypothetical protein